MLLNKYESCDAISKDGHAEELLFKIEKNLELKLSLETKAFKHLHVLLSAFKEFGEREALAHTDYEPLKKYALKFI